MSDTTYRVLTVYDADTSGAKHEVGSLAVVMDHAINLIERAKNLGESIVKLGADAENTQIALAGLFSAGDFPGAKNFQTSMAMSSEIMKQMRKDARDLPGEFEDLKNIFQFSILGGSQAGKSVTQIETMSAKLMSVTKALGVSSEFAGREFSELMEGRASSRVALFSKLKNLMGDADMDAAKFNALSAPEKWERIQKALGSFGPMIDEYQKTWDAISSTSVDYFKQLVRVGSGGVFGGLKKELREINGWYEKNQTAVDEFVKSMGEDLAKNMIAGFHAMRDAVAFVISNKDTIIAIAKAVASAWLVSKIPGSGGTGSAMSLKGAAGFAMGGSLGLSMSLLSGETDKLAIASATLLGAMSGLPGVIGLVSTALLGLQQFLSSWIDGETRASAMARGDLGDPVSIYKRYEKSGSKLTDAVGADMAGFLMSHKIANAKEGGINNHALMSYLMLATKEGAMDVEGARAFRALALKTASAGFIKGHAGNMAEFGPGTSDASLTDAQKIQQLLAEQKRATAANRPQVNVTQHIMQTVYEAEDGQRVLQMTRKLMEETLKLPVQTAHAMVVGY